MQQDQPAACIGGEAALPAYGIGTLLYEVLRP
jgi:hypothetical protein